MKKKVIEIVAPTVALSLQEKLIAAIQKVLHENKSELTDKIQKVVKKSIKKIVKKIDKKIHKALKSS